MGPVIAGLLALALLAGCSSYRVKTLERPGATDDSKIVWSYAWGLLPGLPEADCPSQLLSEVTVESHFGFDLISVITLGLASPKRVSWTCARSDPGAVPIDLNANPSADSPAESSEGAAASREAGGGA